MINVNGYDPLTGEWNDSLTGDHLLIPIAAQTVSAWMGDMAL